MQYFRTKLIPIAIINIILHSFNIPLNLLTAALSAGVITKAVSGDIRGVAITAATLLAIVIGRSLFDMAVNIPLSKATTNRVHLCKLRMYEQIFKRPLHVLYSLNNGETKEKLNDDFDTVKNKYLSVYPSFVNGILSFVVYFAYIFTKNRWIALILTFISLIQIIPPIVIEKYLEVNYDNCRDIEAKITDFIVEGCRGFLTIKLYGLKQWWLDKLKAYHKIYAKVGNASIYTGTAESTLNDLVSNILTYGTYAIIGLFVLKGFTDIDTGIQSITLSGTLFGTVKTMFDLIKNTAETKVAERRLADFFADDEAERRTMSDNPTVEVSDLSFSYNDEKGILSNLNLSLDPAKLTVIKGKNGCGKSTFLKLVTGLLSCPDNSGSVTVGGVNAKFLPSELFPCGIFYLPQDDADFDFTARELFEMSIPSKAEAAVRIAEEFGLTDELIEKSKLNELSGGERKKAFLSLSFASEPAVLLLDEPTNSLDEAGKRVLRQLLSTRGAIVITHDSFIDEAAEQVCVFAQEGVEVR